MQVGTVIPYKKLSDVMELLGSLSLPHPQAMIKRADIEARINAVYFSQIRSPETGHVRRTICTIALDNGFEVIGEFVVVDPENFEQKLGEHFSFEDAFQKLWPFMALLAKERAYIDSIRLAEAPKAFPNMPEWRSHKVVRGAKIIAVRRVNGKDSEEQIGKRLDDGVHKNYCYEIDVKEGDYEETIEVHADFVDLQNNTLVGGYFVVYSDNYISYSPCEAFADGYSR